MQSLQKILEHMFPGVDFESTVVQPRRILEPEVVLIIPDETQEWNIFPSKKPTSVSYFVHTHTHTHIYTHTHTHTHTHTLYRVSYRIFSGGELPI